MRAFRVAAGRRIWCSANSQRLGAAVDWAAFGSGNAEPSGAAAAGFGGLGFLGRIGLRTGFGGGPAGCSSVKTGLGSVTVVAGVARSPGLRTTCTCTVAGWNLFRA